VAVRTATHELTLCSAGVAVGRFPVALGRGGTGKRQAGDALTPVGTYRLGAPRPSARFGTFIPIAYPTRSQARAGFTGAGVGIHGPPRGWDEAALPSTAVDWTLGCIATGSDDAVRAIANFVQRRRAIVVIR
jgi:murein L,D-transpeptidase YafK